MLYGDTDQNVLVGYADGSRRILKISQSGSCKAGELISLQVAILLHIQGKTAELACPQPVKTIADQYSHEVIAADGGKHHAWMLKWLPGNVLDDQARYDDGLLYSIGRSMALIDHALLDFDHPRAHRHIGWDLLNILELRDRLVHVRDPASRNLAAAAFDILAQNMLPQLIKRPAGVIHNDGGNQHNMLVESTAAGASRVTGVIDFGDAVFSHRICELGIAAAYATFGCTDLAASVSTVAAGFHDVLPLGERDRSLLPWLVMARFLMSVCHAAERANREPDNAYAQVSASNAWAGLRTIMCLDMQQLADQIAERLSHG